MIQLPIKDIYKKMLEELEAPENKQEGEITKAKEDLARIVETIIHENYQKL